MSINVQVRVITGEFEKKAMKTIFRGTMQIREDVTCIPAYDGVFKDGIIEKANEEVKEK